MKPYNEYVNRQTWMVALYLEDIEYSESVPTCISHSELAKQIKDDVVEHCDTGMHSSLIENMLNCFINHVDFWQLADSYITKTP